MYLPSVPPLPHLNPRLLPPTQLLPRSSAENDSPTCGFSGNPDVYGIGIRLGIYAQILAVYIANYFLLSEARLLRDAISIFTLALLTISFIYASNPSTVHAVEAFILLQILAWCCLMGVRVRSSYTKGVFSRGSILRKVFGDVANLMMVFLHVWFWWTGVGHMKSTPCGTWLMMYVVKTSLFGWARKVMMAWSVFVLVCTVYWVGVEFSRTWSIWRIKKAKGEFGAAVRRWMELDNGVGGAVDVEVKEKEEECGTDNCAVVVDVPEPGISLEHTTDTLATGPATLTSSSSSSTSLQKTLSSSGPLQETPSSRPSSPNPDPGPDPDLTSITQTLYNIYQSELYIQHCVSSTPYQTSSSGKPLPFPTIARLVFSSENQASISWFQCYLRTWTALFTFSFPPRALAIYLHLRQAYLMDPLNGPFQMYAAMTYKTPPTTDSTNGLPTWQDVSLASEMLLNAPDRPKKVWLGWYYAILDLVIHVIVILQLELTLYWNNVSGLQVLWSNVGQLIPFIVGVGGLGLVLARWAEKWWGNKGKRRGNLIAEEKGKDGDGDEEESGRACGFEKDVRDGYIRWKERHRAKMAGMES